MGLPAKLPACRSHYSSIEVRYRRHADLDRRWLRSKFAPVFGLNAAGAPGAAASTGVDTDFPPEAGTTPASDNRLESGLRSSAVDYLTAKCLGKRSRLLFTFKIDPPDICTGNLPETDGLEFHMIEPGSHLTQLMGQVSSVNSYFDNVEH
jgi:hypothetical protein